MSFDEAHLVDLMKLSYIDCSEEERLALTGHLRRVLEYIEQLQTIDTEGVEPCYRVTDIGCALREDVVSDMLSRDLFLAGAPAHTGGMVRVPPVMKEE